MLTLGEYMAIFCVEFAILVVQILHFVDVLLCEAISVVCCIFSSHLDWKRAISQIEEFTVVGVTGHHSCSCPPVCQNRSHVIDPISSCRVSADEDLIRVYKSLQDESLNDDGEEFGKVGFPPHVRCLLAWPACDPDDPTWHTIIVKTKVVDVLLLVDFGRAPASSVQSEQ